MRFEGHFGSRHLRCMHVTEASWKLGAFAVVRLLFTRCPMQCRRHIIAVTATMILFSISGRKSEPRAPSQWQRLRQACRSTLAPSFRCSWPRALSRAFRCAVIFLVRPYVDFDSSWAAGTHVTNLPLRQRRSTVCLDVCTQMSMLFQNSCVIACLRTLRSPLCSYLLCLVVSTRVSVV